MNSKLDLLTKVIQTVVYDCIRNCAHISNEFPVQPAKPGTPKAGSPSILGLLAKVIQTVVYGCIRKCARISNEFPVTPAQPAQPGTPKAGSPSKLNLLTKVIQTVVYDCIRKYVHISNEFPVQPVQPASPAKDSQHGIPFQTRVAYQRYTNCILSDCIRKCTQSSRWCMRVKALVCHY